MIVSPRPDESTNNWIEGLTSGAEQKREEAKPRIPGQAIKHKCRK